MAKGHAGESHKVWLVVLSAAKLPNWTKKSVEGSETNG